MIVLKAAQASLLDALQAVAGIVERRHTLPILANVLMIPLGFLTIKVAKKILRVPRNILMPIILIFCIVGSFSINNSVWGVTLILFFGLVSFVLEENGFPVAPAILGVVLGTMMEENFVTSMIKSDGDPLVFFTRPIAMWLAISTIVILLWPVGTWAYDRIKNGRAPEPSQ
jgi:TctA family transporter